MKKIMFLLATLLIGGLMLTSCNKPDPEPTPTPDPEPTPDPDVDTDTDVEPEPTPDPTPSVGAVSYILKKSTQVFASPNKKFPIDDIVGPIRVLDGEYTDFANNLVFKRVQYRLPGNGRKAVGYVLKSAVTGV